MSRYEFRMPRIHVDGDLRAGTVLEASPDQTNYLLNVMRLAEGGHVLVFNGRDGEWKGRVRVPRKRVCLLEIVEQTRAQTAGPDLHYLFAPLKRARLDYMVEKATEMGADVLQPVLTQHTQAERVNLDRMRANVIEAAEQCGVLRVPQVRSPLKLEEALGGWDRARHLIFCDEDAEIASPIEALAAVRGQGADTPPVAVLIGPEGGFSLSERAMLLGFPFVRRLSLGPRILRADTAAVAALSLVNAVLGDWR